MRGNCWHRVGYCFLHCCTPGGRVCCPWQCSCWPWRSFLYSSRKQRRDGDAYARRGCCCCIPTQNGRLQTDTNTFNTSFLLTWRLTSNTNPTPITISNQKGISRPIHFVMASKRPPRVRRVYRSEQAPQFYSATCNWARGSVIREYLSHTYILSGSAISEPPSVRACSSAERYQLTAFAASGCSRQRV